MLMMSMVGVRASKQHCLSCLENLLTKVTCLKQVPLECTLQLQLLHVPEKDVVQLPGLLTLLGLLSLLLLDDQGGILQGVH